MSVQLEILSAGPRMTLQDAGRVGLSAYGLSRGGAMDPVALAEAAALLGSAYDGLSIEMTQTGGKFRCMQADLTVALTGAVMKANVDGVPLRWGASHLLPAGAVLEVSAARQGVYGYLSVAGQISVPDCFGARSAHLQAGIGAELVAGDVLPVQPKPALMGNGLPERAWNDAQVFRVLPSVQTALFGDDGRAWLETTSLTKTARSSRMGAALQVDGDGVAMPEGLSITSEIVSLGDIQMTGDGTPFVLLAEAQTTGGYPRIATVISADLPAFAQVQAGKQVRFRFVDLEEALAARATFVAELAALKGRVAPLVRDPHQMHDLLGYTLVAGVVSATDPETWE
ncbi:biotin-dependent carboxyltransferase family protein [Donghicola tyrosinivorans]|uniref:Allophanate hydrolase n=1 Tax=Donghicola tyrosinivorans TaxID=1652492 RepID=A0A2T0WJE3_9RHOB|nr:biotin-dependent carboxyltransferase family protein [Donghicola tyrosinivorans]PRY86830.1 allophanate hydrolase [Donghicola tyrosinivorans]